MRLNIHYILIFILIFESTYIYSNEIFWTNIDSRFDSLTESMEKWAVNKSDSIDTDSLITEMEKVVSVNNNPQLMSRLLYWKSYVYNNMPADSLEIILDKAKVLCDSTRYPYDMARINLSEAIFKSHKAKYAEAFRLYLSSYDFFLKIGDGHFLSYTSYNMGYIFLLLEEYEESEKYLLKADSIFSARKYKTENLQCKLLLATIYNKKEEDEKAKKILSTIVRNINDNYPTDLKISALSTYLLCLNDNDSVRHYADIAYRLAQKTNDNDFIMLTTINKGLSLIECMETDSAYYFALKAQNSYCKNRTQIRTKEGLYKLLAYTYAERKQWKEAYINLKAYYNLRDSLRGKNVLADINRVKIKKQIEENRMSEIIEEQKNRQTKQYFLIIGATLVILLITSYYIILLLYKKMQAEQKKQREKDLEYITLINKEKELIESKNRELSSNTILLMRKNNMLKEMLKDMENISMDDETIKIQKRIGMELKQDTSLESFKVHFDKVHPMFFSILKERHPALTENELRLCAYIKIGLNNKQIAQILLVQVKAVIQAKYRLKKRMELPEDVTLSNYLKEIKHL